MARKNNNTVSLNSMAKAVKTAYETNNKKPITLAQAVEGGATPKDFSNWTRTVEELRIAACIYGEAVEQNCPTDEQREAVWAGWKNLLKIDNTKWGRVFVLPQDAETIRVYATGLFSVVTPVGNIPTRTPKDQFRRILEQFLGARMAGNALLNDEDRDIILSYNKYSHQKAKAADLLDGFARGDNFTEGLSVQIAVANDKLSQTRQALTEAGIDEATINTLPAVEVAEELLSSLKKALASAQKSLAEAEAELEKLTPKYKAIMNSLKSISLEC